MPTAHASEPVTVFAAASLKDAMTAIADRFEAKHTVPVRFSFAASSTLARQIEAGAPAHIFASANAQWMDRLMARGLLAPGSRRTVIGNRLALITPAGRGRPPPNLSALTDLAFLLGPEGYLAMGDPDHVPAGIYAREALEHLGLWPVVEARLARTDNVRAALALVARGEAPLGIVYATDARISPNVRVVGVLPEDSHPPIRYPFAILAGQRTERTEAFFTFLTGAKGLAIFAQFGFLPVD